jgi:cytochrome c oxidase subunit 1
MDHVEPEPGFFDWEAERTGEQGVARDRAQHGGGQEEQSSATIVDDRPRGTDEDEEGRK